MVPPDWRRDLGNFTDILKLKKGTVDIGKKKVSFPMVANYNSVVRYFVECGLDTVIMPPEDDKADTGDWFEIQPGLCLCTF